MVPFDIYLFPSHFRFILFQAYRIEPLVLKHYSTIAPLKIHKIHDNKKTPYSEMKAKAYAAFSAKKGTQYSKPVLTVCLSEKPHYKIV